MIEKWYARVDSNHRPFTPEALSPEIPGDFE